MTGENDGLAADHDLRIDGTSVPHHGRVEVFAHDGECLVYHPARDEATALNRTATDVWSLCDGALSVDAIAQALARRYGVDDDALAEDVGKAMRDLLARDLIDIRIAEPADS